ncbi:MAG: hypothetical protein AMXMBFR13_40800 [Phycisphaerae bacterium]
MDGQAFLRPAVVAKAARKIESQFGGVLYHREAQARLDRIGAALLEAAPDCGVRCYFRLLGSSHLNALSVPEGGIYITVGLYNALGAEDLLAAALAHELAHIAAGDGWRPSKSSRDQLRKEIQADLRAISYLSSAGYDPGAMRDLVRLLRHEQRPGWSASRSSAMEDALAPKVLVVNRAPAR